MPPDLSPPLILRAARYYLQTSYQLARVPDEHYLGGQIDGQLPTLNTVRGGSLLLTLILMRYPETRLGDHGDERLAPSP